MAKAADIAMTVPRTIAAPVMKNELSIHFRKFAEERAFSMLERVMGQLGPILFARYCGFVFREVVIIHRSGKMESKEVATRTK
jgi:hypothetical protein